MTSIKCDCCGHQVEFRSLEEAARFVTSSGWTIQLNGHRCPVCVSDLANGKAIRNVRPSIGAEYRPPEGGEP